MFDRLPALTLFALLLSQVHAAAVAAQPYPPITDEQFAQWKHLMVIAELSPGEYYEKQTSECPQDHVCISMDPPPFWLNAKVSATMSGDEAPPEIRISTFSHYGMSRYATGKAPYLVSLRSDGEKYLMPRYAHAPLVRDNFGMLYLQVLGRHAVHWLPCGVASLREEVFQEHFDKGAAPAKDQYEYNAKLAPELFQVQAKGAWPRYAISMVRLREFLQKAASDVAMSCEPGSEVGKTQSVPVT